MNAKKALINHEKKGTVELGSLSFNEVCRFCVTLMEEVTKSRQILQALHDQHIKAQEEAKDTKEEAKE